MRRDAVLAKASERRAMSRIAYVNGAYAPLGQAAVLAEDRGFQFADGVYEVWSLVDGRLLDCDAHIERLERSLRELRIPSPMTPPALLAVVHETIRRNRVRDGIVYLQITRGAAPRDHAFPRDTSPTLAVTVRGIDRTALSKRTREGETMGVALTLPIQCWHCRVLASSFL